MSIRDSILAAIGDTAPVAVEVPEWNSTIYLRQLNVSEWMALANLETEDKAWQMLSAAMQDEYGNVIFTADEITDMPSNQSSVLIRLFNKMQEVNGGNDLGEE